ncbi:benzoate/H(+) symporter BenE family transporter [Bradyrhizobium ontarionense]|uniref:Benzoate/H(+) symporter BenE family transporter n=1 Tax=Bradyrhizobium ontarionense TaxID=2898149 RepID=A0ABY3R972_9BRAD|nr:benzoate/H(+) symporter BenE family transporter [Bradyrhizobium sp. A19]UFZ03587.1 benzoate/H(+) symporter BenE family transporter [Bradyrhizobium sp. A19]
MLNAIERPAGSPPSAAQIISDFGPLYASHGFIGWLFAITGPVAIILSVGANGGLSQGEIASWIFGVFFINGLITMLLSWRYREPLVLFWTIPGTVLVGQSLTHLTFPQVVGAFYGTALLMLILGLSGWVKRAMQLVPMPIVMGMVAGVFLRFGLDLVRAVITDVAVAGPMVAVWLVLTALPGLGRRCPPIIGALVVGTLVALVFGKYDQTTALRIELIRPVIQTPSWSLAAMIELIVPLAVTVLVVQNGQGFAVLQAAGHAPPINLVTVACGIGSALSAVVGGVSTCLTGPTNAIVVSGGERKRHYTAAIAVGVLALGFGLLAPTFTSLLLIAPKSLITALAGLAMLRVLQTAFVTAFKARFSLGALIAFLVTVADVPLLNIGAAFWGLVAGFALSWLLERADFAANARA